MIVGITGSFGSGKTTVASLLQKCGFLVINLDSLYHGIYKKNKSLQKKIMSEFNTLDRGKIKKIVFNDSKKLKRLNALTHPFIFRELKKEIQRIKRKHGNARIAIDIPLLFESKSEKMFDHILVVKASKKRQLSNILKKEKKYSKREISQIIASQMPLSQKIKKADFVITNDSIPKLRIQVEDIVQSLTKYKKRMRS